MSGKPRVVIVGGGFAGLYAARTLAKAHVDVLLIDRNNFHTFTPLLYQVATCALDPSAIAYPLRTIFRKYDNLSFLMGSVIDIDTEQKHIVIETQAGQLVEPYSYLIVATGTVTNYFGQKAIEDHAFGLKELDDAVILRNHILSLFERAAWVNDTGLRDALTTLVVVGGGPTGIETSGALYELYNYVLKNEYSSVSPKMRARVILLEAMPHLLAPYPERLRKAAKKQLESLGVEVMLDAMVSEVHPDRIVLKDGRSIRTYTLVWSAGVKTSPLVEKLGVDLQKGGRVPVEPNMLVKGKDDVFVVGDIAYLQDDKGDPYPQLIPVAKQQGILAANNILNTVAGRPMQTFSYSDRGIMATIGRSRAVAWIFYRIQLTGFIAWLAWLFLHLVALLGFRNRLSVFISWVWNYLTYDRSVRLILATSETDEALTEKVVAEETL
ncbi:MAG: NAD(P)/FAD-dependent oxidoreductase [Anaerolineaceae bacterium]|nr:NAD(P)/FAD-dependent oxidoreductase [Anaerolineaceae bacterium]